LRVDGLAEASLLVLDLNKGAYDVNTEPMRSHINVGTGHDVTIAGLARTIADSTGFEGAITFYTSKPDGTPRKLMDVSRLASMGWTASIGLEDGLRDAYQWFLNNDIRG